ncbi:GPO family capsid scaffolding protein [Sphingomonas melonis]|uniref:GPO family capsid scaffolding protein n=1 Tax=Sphingomonas melonis TaxID=152682 RepID=UPI0035C86C9F
MGTKSKFFRAFVAGQTISDGRVITPEMIGDIVATFNPESYTPRINIEHISGYSPEPPFNGYGSVIAVKQQTDDITIAGKTEKRAALYCQVDANDQLVALSAKDQKPFPSVELTDSYAGTGKVGMLALAFTDNPASVATQALKFSRSAPGTVHAHGDAPAAIEFEAPAADPTSVSDAIVAGFSRVAAMFKPAPPEPKKEEPKEPANDNDRFASAIEALGTTFAAAIQPIAAAQAASDKRFTDLEQRLAKTEVPGGFSRAPHAGGTVDAKYLTDC